jgi:hypothetical protein
VIQIKTEQLDAMRRVRREEASRRIASALARQFPAEHAIAGLGALQRLADIGIARASVYGIHSEGDLYRFASLMVFFGVHYDEDCLLSWTTPLRRRDASGAARMNAVFNEATRFLRLTAGERGELYRRSLVRLHHIARDYETRQHPPLSALRDLLCRVYPERFATVGTTAYGSLSSRIEQLCDEMKVDGDRGGVFLGILLFMLGTGFRDDPLRADIAAAAGGVGPLHAAAVQHLDRYLSWR